MPSIKNAYIAIRRIGLVKTVRMIRYSLERDLQEKKSRRARDQETTPQLPGNLQSIVQIAGGAAFTFENANVEIRFLASDLVQISWEPGFPPVPYAISKSDWPAISVDLTHKEDSWCLSSTGLEIQVSENGSLRYLDSSSKLLREERPPSFIIGLERKTSRTEFHWSQKTLLHPEAAIFGLGLRALKFNLRGFKCQMWNSDPPGGYRHGIDPLYLCIPVYFVIHAGGCYLIFVENSFPGAFHFGRQQSKHYYGAQLASREAPEDEIEVKFEGGMLRQYFFTGSPEDIFERYSELTGRPPLPPRWSLGYHHSRWGFSGEAEVRKIVESFQRQELPINAIHLDIDYQDGFRIFTVDRQKFPDLPRLSEDLNDKGIKLVGILEPGVKVDNNFSVYQQGLRERIFSRRADGKLSKGVVWPGWCVYPDFTDPHAREWWCRQYQQIEEYGFSGYWHDMNEPTSLSAWGKFSLPSNTHHSMEGRGGDHRQAHNFYGLLMNKAGFSAMRRIRPNQRPWLLTRSGWAGIASCAWSWSGDLESSWEGLRQTVPSLLGLSLSGVPFCGADIGGFQGDPEPELYLRWFQLASFTPFFRTHSSIESKPREPWLFDDFGLRIIRKYLNIRKRLVPYLYTLAWIAAEKGLPLMRPLFWDHPEMPDLWDIDDAFLLGSDLLVAPILHAGVTKRKVLLPPGNWFSFWDASCYRGPSQVTLSAQLDEIPLLARAGSIIPIDEGSALTLHLYPAEVGTSISYLYHDSGDGYGSSRIDRFSVQWQENHLSITRENIGDFHPTWQPLKLIVHGMRVKKVWIDSSQVLDFEYPIVCPWFTSLKIEGNPNKDGFYLG